MALPLGKLCACPCCGLVQELPELGPGDRARCGRCGGLVLDLDRRRRSNARTAAAALAGLVLYPFAISMPIMRIERFGHQRESSILTGAWDLMFSGDVLIGIVVILCSMKSWILNRKTTTTKSAVNMAHAMHSRSRCSAVGRKAARR